MAKATNGDARANERPGRMPTRSAAAGSDGVACDKVIYIENLTYTQNPIAPVDAALSDGVPSTSDTSVARDAGVCAVAAMAAQA